jgi:hypothetical protein
MARTPFDEIVIAARWSGIARIVCTRATLRHIQALKVEAVDSWRRRWREFDRARYSFTNRGTSDGELTRASIFRRPRYRDLSSMLPKSRRVRSLSANSAAGWRE